MTALRRYQAGIATPESYVIQANSLSRSRFDGPASLHGFRLLAVAISKVDTGSDLLDQIVITNEELRSIFPSYRNTRTLCTSLSEAADRLMGLRAETYNGPGDWEKINLVHKAKYHKGKGGLTITFSPDMRPLLLKLRGNYTKYQLKSIAHLNTSYQAHLYNFLRSHVHHRGTTISLEDLRQLLRISEDKYQANRDLHKRVIAPTVAGINEHTDIEVEVRYIRTGRTYSSAKFLVTLKKGEDLDLFAKAVEALLVQKGVERKAAREFASEHSIIAVVNAVAYSEHRSNVSAKTEKGPIANLGGYIAQVLRTRIVTDEGPEFLACKAAVLREFRVCVYQQMSPVEQAAIKTAFAETLSGRDKIDFERFGDAETASLRGLFITHLQEYISPEAPRTRLTLDGAG